ncbi:MAG: sigma-70 family RNA polymerase sigma factor [Acidimicrobiia bacterium]
MRGESSQVEARAGETRPLTELVVRAIDGDARAWDAIVDRFAGMVWAIARRHRLSAADAADVSQTTWLRLVEHLDRIEQPDRIGAWLATTARNESLRVLRIAARQGPARDDDFLDLVGADDTSVDSAILTEVRDRELWELITALPPRCQLLLQFLTDEARPSYVEIGEALKMPTGSIGPTRARCLEHLRRLAASRGISLEYDAS